MYIHIDASTHRKSINVQLSQNVEQGLGTFFLIDVLF